MKHRRILALALALVLTAALAAPAWAADGSYFPDVGADAWYAESVRWAADAGIVKGCPDGSFGVGRACIYDEAVVMLWRAAGSKIVGDGLTDAERAWAWLERQCALSTIFMKSDQPIARIDLAYLLYLALGDAAELSCELPFTDVDAAVEAGYGPALRWCFAKGVMRGVDATRFAPDATVTREQAVTVLRRCFDGALPVTVTKARFPVYFGTAEPAGEMELAFLDGMTEIPYIGFDALKDLMEVLGGMLSAMKYNSAGYALTFEPRGDRVVVTRENGFYMLLDFDTDTISFLDYDAFVRVTTEGSVFTVVDTGGLDEEGNARYIRRVGSYAERYGRALTLDLGAYGLHLVRQGDEYLLPFQTITDLLMSPQFCVAAFNGAGVFVSVPEQEEAMELYYSVPTGQRSDALALFTYKELCFVLDLFYGLAEEHGIRSFAEEFQMIEGMQEGLLSADPARFDEALANLLCFHLDDLHSGLQLPSPLEGTDIRWSPESGASRTRIFEAYEAVTAVRAAVWPDGVPGYEEVGDVAFITFDEFSSVVDYYGAPPGPDATDTYGVMLYAFSQIKREGSPIKHVVLDLSHNGGGSVQAAAFVISALLGEGSVSAQNTLTGSLITESFRADTNLDRVFDEDDELSGVHLYCLTSPFSFSSANLVANALKASNRVTMMGRTSGGGSCVVFFGATADGAFYRYSSFNCLSFLKNGSLYNIDQGAAPDVYVRDWATFADRAALADVIHGLK